MKELKMVNLKIDERNAGALKELNMKDLCKSAINSPPKEGFTADDLRKRIKIMDKVDNSNGVLKLEDAEVEVLKACVGSMKWAILDSAILKFVDDVQAL